MKQTITLNPNTSGKVHFHITPTAKNGYTVQVGEFTKYFTAKEDIGVGYYSPFGGVRMPIAREITIPDVDPYWSSIDPPFDGGDLVLPRSGPGIGYRPTWAIFQLPRQFTYVVQPEVKAKLHLTYVSLWDCRQVSANNIHAVWRTKDEQNFGEPSILLIVPTAYDCPPYWDTKEQLAEMISRAPTVNLLLSYFPVGFWEALVHYGLLCNACGGTGWQDPGVGWTCPECGGFGAAGFHPIRGTKGQVKWINFFTPYPDELCIRCPYCNKDVGHTKIPSDDRYFNVSMNLLAHIEEKHPYRPLTQYNWEEKIK